MTKLREKKKAIRTINSLDVCALVTAQIWLYEQPQNAFLQYLVWLIFPLTLVTFSVGFTHIVSPHAVGRYKMPYNPLYDSWAFPMREGWGSLCSRGGGGYMHRKPITFTKIQFSQPALKKKMYEQCWEN